MIFRGDSKSITIPPSVIQRNMRKEAELFQTANRNIMIFFSLQHFQQTKIAS